MKRVLFLSSHYLASRRRAGFHWLAEAFRRKNWHVTFATVGIGLQSRLRGDFRIAQIPPDERNRLVAKGEGLDSFVWYTPFFPVNLKNSFLNWLSTPLFALFGRLPLGGLKKAIQGAHLIIFESNPSLLLVRRVRGLNPKARLVYRVSDDLRLLKSHPLVLAAERRALSQFALISVVTKAMEQRLPGAIWQSHGVEKQLFDQPGPSPYPGASRNAVFIGTFDYDAQTVSLLAEAFADWNFHVIGPMKPSRAAANLIHHGEMSYAETIPYLCHADVGLATRLITPDVWLYSDSLKMLQYTYARLPILAPEGTLNHFGNVFSYRGGDMASLRAAMQGAIAFDRNLARKDMISSWDELAGMLAG